MDWPYLPFSEALEHAAAPELDAATSVRHAIAAAIVPLLIVPLQIIPLRIHVFIFLSPRICFLDPKASVVPFERHTDGTRQGWQWSPPDDWLDFS